MRNYGLKRANKYAVPKGLKLVACDNSFTVCEDVFTVTASGTDEATEIVYDGVTYEFSAPVEISNTSELETAISAIIGQAEVNVKVNASYGSGDLTLTHEGAGTLESITIDGSAETGARNCTLVYVNEYKTQGVTTDAATFTIDGDDNSLTPGDYTAYDQTSADALAADIEGFLTGASVDYDSVVVEPLTDSFRVTIHTEGEHSFEIDGKGLILCDVNYKYEA